MHERYEYRTIRIQRGAWTNASKAAHAIDGLFGLWRGEIGWHSDEGALMSVGDGSIEDLPGVLAATIDRLEATVRPIESIAPTEDGVYAHRWFQVAVGDLDEFIDLSAAAWPDFEATYDGTRIVGLWKDLDASDPVRLLLVTRYPSLAVWEASRPYTPGPGAEQARAKFMRRAELTQRTIVRIGRLTSAS